MMEKGNIIIAMEINILVNIKIIKKKVQEYIITKKGTNMKENTKMIKWMEGVYTFITNQKKD